MRVLKAAPASDESGPVFAEIRTAAVVYNPASGRRRARRRAQIEEAARILSASHVDAAIVSTTSAGSATQIARDAVRGGCEMIVVCGGDGTINEVVNGIAGTRTPLAILPAGTANILAKELRIPWNIPAAARLIPKSRLVRIALGAATWRRSLPEAPEDSSRKSSFSRERCFLCAAGAGPDAAIVHGVRLGHKARLGILSYWLEGFRQFLSYPFPRFRVASPERELTASLLVVGRTKHYGGPFRITTGASLFEDQFEVVAYAGRSRMNLLPCLPAICLGFLQRMPGIRKWKTSQIVCTPLDDSEIFSQLDGEPAAALPVAFRIVPHALTLAVPQHASAAGKDAH